MFGIQIEKIDNLARFIVIEKTKDGRFIRQILEADAETYDNAWSLIEENVILDNGDFEEADCLSIREAAEAYFGIDRSQMSLSA